MTRQPAWIRIAGSWHVLRRVDTAGWRTACGELATGDSQVLDDEPPDSSPKCPRCLDLEREPEP